MSDGTAAWPAQRLPKAHPSPIPGLHLTLQLQLLLWALYRITQFSQACSIPVTHLPPLVAAAAAQLSQALGCLHRLHSGLGTLLLLLTQSSLSGWAQPLLVRLLGRW